MHSHPPAVILVRPQMAENIGAAARAMVNFGAYDLRLVAPQAYDPAHAERMACDGREVLLHAKAFPDLKQALADCVFSVATTRRLRHVKIQPWPVKTALTRCLALPGSSRWALVFGSEQSGLSNEETFLCDAASTIPVSEKGSLNLGQAVVVYLYEWFQLSAAQPANAMPEPAEHPATHAEKQRAYDLLQKLLLASDYQPIGRLPEFMRRVKYLFETRPLAYRENKILLKALRYLEKLVPQKTENRE